MIYIYNDNTIQRKITNVYHDTLNKCYYYNDILDNGEIGRYIHTISEETFNDYVVKKGDE